MISQLKKYLITEETTSGRFCNQCSLIASNHCGTTGQQLQQSISNRLSDHSNTGKVKVPNDKWVGSKFNSTHTEQLNNATINESVIVDDTTEENNADDHPCKKYGLLVLGNNTCYQSVSMKMQNHLVATYNKTIAIKECEKLNATLPYSKIIFT